MNKKELITSTLVFLGISVFFFYKFFFMGLVPFPGDLLIAEYNPWKTYSYLGYNPGSFPHKAQYFDTIRQLYPWKTLSSSLIKNAQVPLWNPYNFSGTPLLANFQSAIFYPFNLLYFTFPQIFAWSILVFFQPLIACISTYLYLRKINASTISSYFGAVAFSFSLFMTSFLEYNTIGHVIAWLPFMLYGCEYITENFRKYAVLFSIGFLFSFFAGHIQLFGFNLIFATCYIGFRIFSQKGERKKKLYSLIKFLVLICILFGITSVQLLPTIELIHYSARVPQNFTFLIEKLLIQPYQLILFLSPDIFGNPATRNYLLKDSYPGNALYIGVIPFLFSIYGLNIKEPISRFFSVAIVLLLIVLVRNPLSEFIFSFPIPFISTGSPTNALFLLSFSLAVLAAKGFDAFIHTKKKSIIGYSLISFLILVLYGLTHTYFNFAIIQKNFIYSSTLLLIALCIIWVKTFTQKRIKLISVVFLIITILDLWYFFIKFNPFTPPSFVFPSTSLFTFLTSTHNNYRFWGYGKGAIEANFATQYSLFHPDGYDPLYPKWYGEFIQGSTDGKIHSIFTNTTRSDAVIAHAETEKDIQENNFRKKILDILGVKYFFQRESILNQIGPQYSLIYNKDNWQVYENKTVLPRAFLVNNVNQYKSSDEFRKKFFSSSFDPARTVLLEENINLPKKSHLKSLVTEKKYSPSEVAYLVQTDADALLFISDTYFPGWEAYVDHKEEKILRANYAFRAIKVPSGTHTVVLRYAPTSFFLGTKISIISMIILIAFIKMHSFKKYE